MKKFQDVVNTIAEIEGSPRLKVQTRLYNRIMNNQWTVELRMEVIRSDGKRGKVMYIDSVVADALIAEAQAQTILREAQKL